MGVMRVNRRATYEPLTTDSGVRERILRDLDQKHGVPLSIPDEYPDRGNTILQKVLSYVNSDAENPVLLEPSPLKTKKVLEDMLVILCYYGTDTSRLEAAKRCMDELLTMNPLPRVCLMEASVDGQYRLNHLASNPDVFYQHIDCTAPSFRNFFLKETLWNVAANAALAAFPLIRKLVFLDIDTVYVDKYSFSEVSRALDTYDVISPMSHCYYTGSSKEAKTYKLMPSTGQKAKMNSKHAGWQGFGLGMTIGFFDYIHRELPCCSVGFGDCLFWWLLLNRTVMRNCVRIPYDRRALLRYAYRSGIRVGAPNTILQHLDHGSLAERQYGVKCRLIQRAIKEPFSDMARVGSTHLFQWADNDETNCLRVCLENLIISNRNDVKLTTEKDGDELFDYLTGYSPRPPEKFKPDVFTLHGNIMPFDKVAQQGMDNTSKI